MATTTNYGWTTPDDTALVKDGASAIRTLGSSADTTVKALSPGTTAGDLDYYTAATTKARIGIGSTSQVLTVTGGVPVWATPTSGGMTLISTTTLSGASITLSSIPATYNDLKIVVRLLLNATDNQEFLMRMNADATASRHFWANAYTSTTNSTFDATSIRLTGGQDNAVTQSIITLTIPDYANTSTWKFCNFNSFTNNATTTTNFVISAGFGAYNQTGAISSLQFLPAGGNFTSGTVLLYGVK